MSFIGDFFKSLANNPNVVDDEQVENELKHFLIENSESSKRVAFLEESIVDKDTLKKVAKQAVQKYKSTTSGSSNKVEKEFSEKEKVDEEIEK